MTSFKTVTPEEAVSLVKSGDRVYVGSNCAQPSTLCSALTRRHGELRNIEVVHLLTFGEAPYCATGMEDSFRHSAFFIAANTRQAVAEGRADYIPVFLSEIPFLFSSGQLPIDVAMVAVAPPDEHGYCSLGISVDIGMSACRSARVVIAEIQPRMPRTHGDSALHVSEIAAFCTSKQPLVQHASEPPDAVSRAIAANIAPLVRDGACLQTGFGKLPGAVLEALHDKNDLGVHTEMFSDELVALVANGNINGRRKTLHRGKVVTTFAIGTDKLYEEVHDNPFYEFRPTEQVNDPWIIAQNEDMVAINSAIEVDLTGQVVADSIGPRFYSGIGGQVDFIRGAGRSKRGRPIIALPSTALGGKASRITACLKPHSGVVTTRGDVHYIVTEYGVAYLRGRSIRERAEALIEIAHPSFRDELRETARELGYCGTRPKRVFEGFDELPGASLRRRFVRKHDGDSMATLEIDPAENSALLTLQTDEPHGDKDWAAWVGLAEELRLWRLGILVTKGDRTSLREIQALGIPWEERPVKSGVVITLRLREWDSRHQQ
ncbi:MAG: acetyl-CoA hydrolase/transferase family protein [Armatimonadetes bacterium]|nr:acetyl-CoA hydrolase/transferase family protein [Armatimonadota bacterium]